MFLSNFAKIGLVRPGLAAAAVIRPEHTEGGQNHENRLFMKKRVFKYFDLFLTYFWSILAMAMAWPWPWPSS